MVNSVDQIPIPSCTPSRFIYTTCRAKSFLPHLSGLTTLAAERHACKVGMGYSWLWIVNRQGSKLGLGWPFCSADSLFILYYLTPVPVYGAATDVLWHQNKCLVICPIGL